MSWERSQQNLVVVFDAEDKEVIGIGNLRREDLKIVDDDDETKILSVFKNHPHITMENGDVILGIECWWIPLAEFITANQQALPAFGYPIPARGV